ncbi:uncharacterized protein TEOVI_000473400 [Trypanosoma equiperdum]|uniref:Trypanosome variant surface glycoprotein (A-type) n=1 Tax=Trypanosoma equiperdum TaxID=5694 RepID=A0A1G4HY43_TRYEQ|nr:hypothetical protein, conserved [Trypanosoma equiperdum]
MAKLKTAIIFGAAQRQTQDHRPQPAIAMHLAIRRLDNLANRIGNCISKGSDLQRKLATIAGIHLGLTKLTNLETTAVDAGTAHTNGAAENHKVYETTILKNFGDETCGNTFASAAKDSEPGIDLTALTTIKTYKLQQATNPSDPKNICGIKASSSNTKETAQSKLRK